MTNLDISIVFFALVIVLILDILGIGLKSAWLAILGMLFGIASIAYFVQNYTQVQIGSGTSAFIIPFQLFIVAWVVLPILSSFIIALKAR